MAMDWAQVSLSLDIGTLFVIAICVTFLLGLLLLRAWIQEGIPALGWWGAAYLIGAFSGAIWRFGDLIGPALPTGIANILLFVTVGIIWSAARLFHGRPVRWGVMILAKDRMVHFYRMAAATDPLTGVLNRRGFLQGAAIVMERNRRSKMPVSVLAFDLDHFKSINDRWGHAVRDSVLQLFATVVQKTMRADDVIGRFGGEEFVAILPGTLADAAAVAERVRAAFAAAGLELDGRQIAATVSAGVACGSPSATVEALMAHADTALYRAKMSGRDRVETADETVAAAPERRTKERSAAGLPAASLRSH